MCGIAGEIRRDGRVDHGRFARMLSTLEERGPDGHGVRLLDDGRVVLVETSGAIDVGPLDRRAHTIMDLKCPGSGESHRNLWTNLDHLGPGDEVKFVVRDRADWEWAAAAIRERGLDLRVRAGTLRALLVSPVWGEVDLEALADWVLASGLPVRYQVQLHKVIWGPQRSGV